MKMVSKYGNVIMNANTKAEQERLKNLGYNEFEFEEDVRICTGSHSCTCDDGKTEHSSEIEKDKLVANNLKAMGFKEQELPKKELPKRKEPLKNARKSKATAAGNI